MKILKRLLTVISLIVLLAIGISTTNNRMGNCKIEGNIKGLGTCLAFVSGGTNSHKSNFFKLILVWNDHFSFNAKVNEEGGGRILTRSMLFIKANGRPLGMRSKMINFNVNPDEHISIEGEMKAYSVDYNVKGNKLSQQLSAFRNANLPLLEQEAKTLLAVEKLLHEGAGKEIVDAKYKELSELSESYNNKRLEYAKAHPGDEPAALFLQSQAKDTILKYFPLLSKKVKGTDEGKLLQKRIEAWGQVEIGKPTPVFSNITLDGKMFNLAELKGKYIVLDFWGSWCGPCVRGIPKMKEYYKKYSSKLEFVGIACNDKEADWKKAVDKYALPWPQILNDEKSALSIKYTIEVFPTKVLIDKNGNLVTIFKGESSEFYQKLDELFAE